MFQGKNSICFGRYATWAVNKKCLSMNEICCWLSASSFICINGSMVPNGIKSGFFALACLAAMLRGAVAAWAHLNFPGESWWRFFKNKMEERRFYSFFHGKVSLFACLVTIWASEAPSLTPFPYSFSPPVCRGVLKFSFLSELTFVSRTPAYMQRDATENSKKKERSTTRKLTDW